MEGRNRPFKKGPAVPIPLLKRETPPQRRRWSVSPPYLGPIVRKWFIDTTEDRTSYLQSAKLTVANSTKAEPDPHFLTGRQSVEQSQFIRDSLRHVSHCAKIRRCCMEENK